MTYNQLNLNVLGIVENYTGEIFGEGTSKQLAEDVNAPFLGSLSLRSSYRDNSKPTCLLDTDVAAEYNTQYILQPGGSIRDNEIIDKCTKYNIKMVLSNQRVFTH